MALPNLTREQAVERASLITVASYQIDLDLTDGSGAPGAADLPLDHHRGIRRARRRRLGHRHRRRHHPQRHAQRPRPGRLGLRRVDRYLAARAGRPQRRRGRCGLPLLQHRRGPAPVRGPGRQRDLPVLAVRNRRRQAHVRLLRPARHEGDVRRAGDGAHALEGDLQRRDGVGEPTACTPSPPRRG